MNWWKILLDGVPIGPCTFATILGGITICNPWSNKRYANLENSFCKIWVSYSSQLKRIKSFICSLVNWHSAMGHFKFMRKKSNSQSSLLYPIELKLILNTFFRQSITDITLKPHDLQRVPALCGFWDLKKTVLCKIHVSGIVEGPLLTRKSPTCTYIS